MRYIVGIDLGGTNIVAGTVSEDGSQILGVLSEPTGAEGGADAVVDRIVQLAKKSIAAAKVKAIAGVGIGSPGPLDTKTGIVLLTPNLGWVNMPLRDRVAAGLGLPATLDNDANCAIYGEWWRGARGYGSKRQRFRTHRLARHRTRADYRASDVRNGRARVLR